MSESKNKCIDCESFDIRQDPNRTTMFCQTCGAVQTAGIISEYICDDTSNNCLYDTPEFIKDNFVETKTSQKSEFVADHQYQKQIALDMLRSAKSTPNLDAVGSENILYSSNPSYKSIEVSFKNTQLLNDSDNNNMKKIYFETGKEDGVKLDS